MKKEELIAHLQILPDDAEVCCWDAGGGYKITKFSTINAYGLTNDIGHVYRYEDESMEDELGEFFPLPELEVVGILQ